MVSISCLLFQSILNGLRKEILDKIALKALGFFVIYPEQKLLKNLAQLPAEGPELLRSWEQEWGLPGRGSLSSKAPPSPSSCSSVLAEAHKEVAVLLG